MKLNLLKSSITACFFCFPSLSTAAGLIIDSFTSGEFDVMFPGTVVASQNINDSIFSVRMEDGSGQVSWMAGVDQNQGNFSYSVNYRVAPPPNSFFLMNYSNPVSAFNLLGTDAFALNVTALTGQGDLVIALESYPTQANVAVSITGAGPLVIPVSTLDPEWAKSTASSIYFKFVPISADFSVTLDEISLIPEPETWALSLVWGLGWVARRRRV